MIQDIKDRIEGRSTTLMATKRAIEDSLLGFNSQLMVYSQQYIQLQDELAKVSVSKDFDSLINEKTQELDKITIRHQNYQGRLDSFNQRLNYLNESLAGESIKKAEYLSNKTKEASLNLEPLKEELATVNALIKTLDSEISKLKAITDTCPTCGQKIPGALKPDTSEKDKLYLDYHGRKDSIINVINTYNVALQEEIKTNSTQFDLDTNRIKEEISKVKSEITTLQTGTDNINHLANRKLSLTNEITSLQNEKKNFFDNQQRLNDKAKELFNTLCKDNTGAGYFILRDGESQWHDTTTKKNYSICF
jgi:predicted transcriptional regulator